MPCSLLGCHYDTSKSAPTLPLKKKSITKGKRIPPHDAITAPKPTGRHRRFLAFSDLPPHPNETGFPSTHEVQFLGTYGPRNTASTYGRQTTLLPLGSGSFRISLNWEGARKQDEGEALHWSGWSSCGSNCVRVTQPASGTASTSVVLVHGSLLVRHDTRPFEIGIVRVLGVCEINYS